ncbi:hypothetical protein [Labrenzia sp. VG12]|nr:hypothetical protein [Labrenzia sp. VG12]
MKLNIALIVLALASMLAGCQSTGSGVPAPEPRESEDRGGY